MNLMHNIGQNGEIAKVLALAYFIPILAAFSKSLKTAKNQQTVSLYFVPILIVKSTQCTVKPMRRDGNTIVNSNEVVFGYLSYLHLYKPHQ